MKKPNPIKKIKKEMKIKSVNQEMFKPVSESEKKKVRKEYHLSKNNFIFLNLGAMTWNKGIDKLLLAFDIINKKFPHTKLILKDQSNLYQLNAHSLIKTVQKKNSIIDKKVLSNILVISKNLNKRKDNIKDKNVIKILSDEIVDKTAIN